MKVIGHAGVGGKLNFENIKRSGEQFRAVTKWLEM